MNNQDIINFVSLWDMFIGSLRKSLMREIEKQPLSYSICSLILINEKLTWTDPESPQGNWLSGYTNKDPVKGNLILNITMEDVKFSEYDEKKKNRITAADIFGFAVIPLLAAAIGCLISLLLHAGFLVISASIILPELIALMIYSLIRSKKKSSVSEVDRYIGQLDKYKGIIAGILDGSNNLSM